MASIEDKIAFIVDKLAHNQDRLAISRSASSTCRSQMNDVKKRLDDLKEHMDRNEARISVLENRGKLLDHLAGSEITRLAIVALQLCCSKQIGKPYATPYLICGYFQSPGNLQSEAFKAVSDAIQTVDTSKEESDSKMIAEELNRLINLRNEWSHTVDAETVMRQAERIQSAIKHYPDLKKEFKWSWSCLVVMAMRPLLKAYGLIKWGGLNPTQLPVTSSLTSQSIVIACIYIQCS